MPDSKGDGVGFMAQETLGLPGHCSSCPRFWGSSKSEDSTTGASVWGSWEHVMLIGAPRIQVVAVFDAIAKSSGSFRKQEPQIAPKRLELESSL